MNKFFTSRNLKNFDLTQIEPVLLFSVFFLPGYISQGIQDVAPDMFESTFFNIFYLVSVIPQILLTLYIIVLKPGRKLSDFDLGPFRKADPLRALLILLGIYACILPVGFITMLLEPELNNRLVYGAGWTFTSYRLIPLVFAVCIATGYAEEIFFRSYLYKSIRNAGAGTVTAAVITTLLFGSGHIYEGYYAFAATSIIGILLMVIFIRTKSIHSIAIAHGLYNFSVLMISMMEVL